MNQGKIKYKLRELVNHIRVGDSKNDQWWSGVYGKLGRVMYRDSINEALGIKKERDVVNVEGTEHQYELQAGLPVPLKICND